MDISNNKFLELETKIKNHIDNNLYLSYFKCIWDRYKFIILFIIVIILITFIEIKVATCTSDCSYMLDKYSVSRLHPPCLDLPEDVYIYVYNSSVSNSKDIYDKLGLQGYNKLTVGEHITDQMSYPLVRIKEGFKNFFSTGTPIHTLTNNIVHS